MLVILHNIRSAYNVGSIFRTADAAGVSELVLAGHTPAPRDRFGRARTDIAKTALGAEKTVPWRRYERIGDALRYVKKHGAQIVALEQHPSALNYRDFFVCHPEPAEGSRHLTLILGSETEGIPEPILKKCDQIIEIPMRGAKESLNVSVAFGVVVFQISDG